MSGISTSLLTADGTNVYNTIKLPEPNLGGRSRKSAPFYMKFTDTSHTLRQNKSPVPGVLNKVQNLAKYSGDVTPRRDFGIMSSSEAQRFNSRNQKMNSRPERNNLSIGYRKK